jgi:hypothetical protein
VSLPLYADVHIPRAIVIGLRLRGVDVLTAQDDQASSFTDPALLDRATSLGRTLFSFDTDLLKEASRRQREQIPFAGLVYAHPARISISDCISHLELIAIAGEPADIVNRVEFLPLWKD